MRDTEAFPVPRAELRFSRTQRPQPRGPTCHRTPLFRFKNSPATIQSFYTFCTGGNRSGESGEGARECDFAWILFSMEQCVRQGVRFHFKQTGANFRKGDRVYHIDRKDQMIQAAKAGVDYLPY
jgi:hypothetical protein